jgi:putative endonuclease
VVSREFLQSKNFYGTTNMYYLVYILENKGDKSWYTGFTTNLKNRLKQHLNGSSPYTSKKGGWRLIYCELYLNKKDALGR